MSLCQFSPARRTPIGRPSWVIGDYNDLRAAGDAPPFAEDVEFDLTEAAGESNLLGWRDVLVAKEDDAVIIIGSLDRGERFFIDWPSQVDTAYLGTDRALGMISIDIDSLLMLAWRGKGQQRMRRSSVSHPRRHAIHAAR